MIIRDAQRPVTVASIDFHRRLCEQSYYDFMRHFWHVVVPEPPVWNWHIEYLCDALQEASERVFRGDPKQHDIICNISPGSTKSTTFSVMHHPWAWARMPTARSICSSFTSPLSLNLSTTARRIVNTHPLRYPDGTPKPSFHDMWPGIVPRADQWTKSHWANTAGGARFAATVAGTSPTGMHGHFLVVDDPIDPQGVRSTAELRDANFWMREVLPTRKTDKVVSVTFLVMQRLHQDDPTGNWLERRSSNILHICLPAEISTHVRPRRLRGRYTDGLMDPIRLNADVLHEARLDLGEFGFSGQYKQHPVPLGGGMFKVDRLQRGKPPATFKRVVRYWDKAATERIENPDAAHSVGVKMAIANDGSIWVPDVRRGQWSSETRERIIKQTAQDDGHDVEIVVEQEPGSGGKQDARNTVKMLAGYRCRKHRPVGDKTTRADAYSVQVNDGNVWLPTDTPWVAEYVAEMQYFPFSKFKDQIDASSGALYWLTKPRRRAGA